jgi:hypothetical protein
MQEKRLISALRQMMVLEQQLTLQRERVTQLERSLYPEVTVTIPLAPPVGPEQTPPTTPPSPEIPPLTPEQRLELENQKMPDPVEELERRLGLST